jgi:single-strand DNA-binding protein
VTTTIQIYGRLGRAPEQRTTAAGKAMVTGAMVVDLGRDGGMPEWFSLVAFGTTGEALARHAKGEMVAVSGRLTQSAWTGRDGTERSGFSVLVDSMASARTVRPGGPKVKSRDDYGGVPFDDSLRF